MGKKMTNQEILFKVIWKAGGNSGVYKKKYRFSPWEYCMKEIIMGLAPYEPLIFSHDFAKAFWGEKGIIKSVIEYDNEIPWEKVEDKELGVYYKDKNHEKFLKEKHSAHMIFKKNNKYVCKQGNDNMEWFEEIELGSWEEYPLAFDYGYWSEGWQCYLEQMVLEKEPLKYLEKFLKN